MLDGQGSKVDDHNITQISENDTRSTLKFAQWSGLKFSDIILTVVKLRYVQSTFFSVHMMDGRATNHPYT